jgi:ABC-type oligopeptide transport system ATPase subunit
MSDTLLEIKNLKKIFKVGTSNVVAVNNISFDIEKYDSLAIVGESGSGKTTLANLILGVEKQTAGSIRYNGEEINFKQKGLRKKFNLFNKTLYHLLILKKLFIKL